MRLRRKKILKKKDKRIYLNTLTVYVYPIYQYLVHMLKKLAKKELVDMLRKSDVTEHRT